MSTSFCFLFQYSSGLICLWFSLAFFCSNVATFTAGYGKMVGDRVGYRHGNIEYRIARVFINGGLENTLEEMNYLSNCSFFPPPPGPPSVDTYLSNSWSHSYDTRSQETKDPRVPNYANRILQQIYFGNWLRDHSLLLNDRSLKYLPERFLVSAINLLSKKVFPLEPAFKVTKEKLGVYHLEEHFDNPYNPTGDPPPSAVDPRLDGMYSDDDISINVPTATKMYFEKSIRYIMAQVDMSTQYARQQQMDMAFLHLGNALHPIEDFFSHSNFVELAFHEIGYNYDQVFPFVGRNTRIWLGGGTVYPLVTGWNGRKSLEINVFSLLKDILLEKVTEQRYSLTSGTTRPRHYSSGHAPPLDEEDDDRPPPSYWHTLVDFFRKKWVKVIKIKVLEKLIDQLNGMIARRTALERGTYNDPMYTNPTHSQLSKDHLDHPLNDLTGFMASIVVEKVVEGVLQIWRGDQPHSGNIYHLLRTTVNHPRMFSDESTLGYELLRIVDRWSRNPNNHHLLARLNRQNAVSGILTT